MCLLWYGHKQFLSSAWGQRNSYSSHTTAILLTSGELPPITASEIRMSKYAISLLFTINTVMLTGVVRASWRLTLVWLCMSCVMCRAPSFHWEPELPIQSGEEPVAEKFGAIYFYYQFGNTLKIFLYFFMLGIKAFMSFSNPEKPFILILELGKLWDTDILNNLSLVLDVVETEKVQCSILALEYI